MDTISSLSDADRKTLEQIPARFADAWNRKDAGAAFADYAEDADFVNVLGTWWRGRERIVKEHADRFTTIFAGSILNIDDVKVRDIAPNAAVVHAVWTMKGHAADPTGRWDTVRTGILIFMVAKRGDHWKIVASQNTDIVKH